MGEISVKLLAQIKLLHPCKHNSSLYSPFWQCFFVNLIILIFIDPFNSISKTLQRHDCHDMNGSFSLR